LTQDDALFRFRKRVISLAEEIGVSAACRAMGVHRSTYYRWRHQVLRYGLDILHPRERRPPRMPNSTSPLIEQRVLAFSLAHPTVGPQRISDELRRPKWGGFKISPNGVHKVVTPSRAQHQGQAPHRRRPSGELVQLDCFSIGRLSAPRAPVGNTPPSTSHRDSCGPSCT